MGDISTHFSRHEFACKCGCGFDAVDAELLQCLERIRHFYGKPVYITSGNRCRERNTTIVGAVEGSYHTRGMAADFVVSNTRPDGVQNQIEQWWAGKYGIGRYPQHTHLDIRPVVKRWQKTDR